ncbi:hypothetical protein HanXRQr2_Chr11g0476871 [Helianthus annuus]|uniref:Uncharacterized protein n=1 Tax=Helianthus annuus TaxID=4232 RepID=A0A9K3HLV5_HELAN|nr:hypothetical protein HanXRQr2_Chr11g0476871 [Helianthus annuus]
MILYDFFLNCSPIIFNPNQFCYIFLFKHFIKHLVCNTKHQISPAHLSVLNP